MDECVQSHNYWLLSVLCMDPEELEEALECNAHSHSGIQVGTIVRDVYGGN